jgi:hypothetical protein
VFAGLASAIVTTTDAGTEIAMIVGAGRAAGIATVTGIVGMTAIE